MLYLETEPLGDDFFTPATQSIDAWHSIFEYPYLPTRETLLSLDDTALNRFKQWSILTVIPLIKFLAPQRLVAGCGVTLSMKVGEINSDLHLDADEVDLANGYLETKLLLGVDQLTGAPSPTHFTHANELCYRKLESLNEEEMKKIWTPPAKTAVLFDPNTILHSGPTDAESSSRALWQMYINTDAVEYW